MAYFVSSSVEGFLVSSSAVRFLGFSGISSGMSWPAEFLHSHFSAFNVDSSFKLVNRSASSASSLAKSVRLGYSPMSSIQKVGARGTEKYLSS